ncbi:MAG: chorismate synthase, partial [Clostridia bacterium]|nr:chorismate synthase [Clostridia bacterium]
MLRFLDAGESHGPGLCAVLEGLPANFSISREKIDEELARRQKGYGRGERMKLEKDQVEIISGLSEGKTTGAPVTILIRNRDHDNWKDKDPK